MLLGCRTVAGAMCQGQPANTEEVTHALFLFLPSSGPLEPGIDGTPRCPQNNQIWTRPKPGAKNSVQVCHVGGRRSPLATCMEVSQKRTGGDEPQSRYSSMRCTHPRWSLQLLHHNTCLPLLVCSKRILLMNLQKSCFI